LHGLFVAVTAPVHVQVAPAQATTNLFPQSIASPGSMLTLHWVGVFGLVKQMSPTFCERHFSQTPAHLPDLDGAHVSFTVPEQALRTHLPLGTTFVLADKSVAIIIITAIQTEPETHNSFFILESPQQHHLSPTIARSQVWKTHANLIYSAAQE
jgi:hypothetical protein